MILLALLLVQKTPLEYPPKLPEGKAVVSVRSLDFLKRPANLREGVEVAATPPEVDFLYYPGQDYPGRPWSVWGDGSAAGTKYWSAVGDHLHPKGTALICEYDAATKKIRVLADVRKVLEASGTLPAGHNEKSPSAQSKGTTTGVPNENTDCAALGLSIR